MNYLFYMYSTCIVTVKYVNVLLKTYVQSNEVHSRVAQHV